MLIYAALMAHSVHRTSNTNVGSLMYPDPGDFYSAAMDYKGTKLEGSYNYSEWRRDMIRHLALFSVDHIVRRSKALRASRAAKDAQSTELHEKLGALALDSDDNFDDTYGDSEDARSSSLAQGIMYSSLSDGLSTSLVRRFPFKNAAVFWDHLYDAHGKPGPADIMDAHRTLFPRGNWPEDCDVMAKIRKQRHAADILSAAGMPIDEKLVTYSHLQYLPQSFYECHAILSLHMLPLEELESQEIFRTISAWVRLRTRQKQCYYHNTISHDIVDCRVVRQLLKQERRAKGKPRQAKQDEEQSVTKIFERIPECDWYCERHETKNHDDKFCVEQLQERIQSR